MQIITSLQQIYDIAQQWRGENWQIGLVPTMGALHDGHLALCEKARQENDKFIASVFVNPTQFAPGEDYQKYFRPFARDCELLKEAGCDAIFAPAPEEMYHENSSTIVAEHAISLQWEGAVRPTHFQGVTTIVTKLFHLIPVHRAYFGEKDYQQLKIIQRMVRDLNFPLEIISVPTVRESDGLAKSSRNAYLSAKERKAAIILYQSLQAAQKMAESGENDAVRITTKMRQVAESEPLFQLDYAAIVDAETLEPLRQFDKNRRTESRAIISGHIGKTHLIDNCAVIFN